MFFTIEEQTVLLNRLQTEINSVLENTGRLFAAAKAGSTAAPAAQAARMKREVPGSIGRFHDALDQLEDEIETARNVMRRDLALARERFNGAQKVPEPINDDVEAANSQKSPPDVPKAEVRGEPTEVSSPAPDERDVVMEDGPTSVACTASPQVTIQPEKPATSPLEASNAIDSLDEEAPKKASDVEGASTGLEASDDQQTQDDEVKAEPKTTEHPNSALRIDTQGTTPAPPAPPAPPATPAPSAPPAPPPAPQQGDEAQPTISNPDIEEGSPNDKPPDTGTFSNNADLDSLFNDSISAGGTSGDALSFGLPTGNSAGAQDFDFSAFNGSLDQSAAAADNGNDDLNNLLPGLSEYANTQPMTGGSSTEVDFDALFAPVNAIAGSGQGSEGEQQQQDFAGEHRDSTFDDLMDFDDFTNGGSGNGGASGNQDFEFTFD